MNNKFLESYIYHISIDKNLAKSTVNVYKKELETLYTQRYSGTVYKAGYDNYYSYIVTIEYIDNSDPTIEILESQGNIYFGKDNIFKMWFSIPFLVISVTMLRNLQFYHLKRSKT